MRLYVTYAGGPVKGMKVLATPPVVWPLPRNLPTPGANGFYYKVEEGEGEDAYWVVFNWMENPLTFGGTGDGAQEDRGGSASAES